MPRSGVARWRQERKAEGKREAEYSPGLAPLELVLERDGEGHKGIISAAGCLSLSVILGPQGCAGLCTWGDPRTKSHHSQGEGAIPPWSQAPACYKEPEDRALLFPSFASHKHLEGGPTVASNPRLTSPMPLSGPRPSSPHNAFQGYGLQPLQPSGGRAPSPPWPGLQSWTKVHRLPSAL